MLNEENKNTDTKTRTVNQETVSSTDIVKSSNNKNYEMEKSEITEKELITKYGKIYKVKGYIKLDDETELENAFFFKKPSVASFDRYLKSAANSSSRALKTFVQDNIVDEQELELETTLEEYPAFTLSLGEKLLEMLGLAKEINIKKL